MGPAPRAERGEVRYLVLDAIAEQERHGYEIMTTIEGKSGGAYRPSPGVIYPTLQMLEEIGHARSREAEGRKLYLITDEGKRELAAHRDEVDELYERFTEESWEAYAEDFGDLVRQVSRMFKAVKRASRRGRMTAATMRAVREVVEDALKKIEAAVDPEVARDAKRDK
jgi:DNA-binding PadR family transcriptional regulator